MELFLVFHSRPQHQIAQMQKFPPLTQTLDVAGMQFGPLFVLFIRLVIFG